MARLTANAAIKIRAGNKLLGSFHCDIKYNYNIFCSFTNVFL